MNKNYFFAAIILIVLIAIALIFSSFLKKKTWNFVGYQYKWSRDYVENKAFSSQLECATFGEMWLQKQDSEEAMFTCSEGCKNDDLFPGAEVCDRVCEYNKGGYQFCRE